MAPFWKNNWREIWLGFPGSPAGTRTTGTAGALLFSNSLISSSSLYSRLYQLTLTLIYPNSVFKPIHKSIQRPKTVFINLYAIFLSKKRFLGDDCPPPPSYYYFFQLRSMFKFWRIVLGTMDLSRTVILEYLPTSPSYSTARAQELVFVIP